MAQAIYKVVIVGFSHVHINEVAGYFHSHPQIRLTAGADVAADALADPSAPVYTRNWNMAYCRDRFDLTLYRNWKQMLQQEQPELCIINSENCYHAAVTEECARLGIGVCVEKPMAMNLTEALKMYRAVKSSGIFFMVNWPIAWNPGLHRLKALVDEGLIGDVIQIKTRMGHTGPFGPGATHHIDAAAQPMSEAEKCVTWWHQSNQGGGALVDYGCYGAMLSHWLLDKPAEAVMGMRINAMHPLADAEDNAALLVRFPGSYGLLEATWTTYDHTFHSPIVYGTKGSLVCDYKTGRLRHFGQDRSCREMDVPPLPNHWKNPAWAYVHHRQTGSPLPAVVTAEYNLHAMAILDAGLRSVRSGGLQPMADIHWHIG